MLRDAIPSRLAGLFAAGPEASPAEQRNTYYLCMEVAWWGLAYGTYLSYMAVFAARLGASNFWIGVLSAGPALVSIFWLLPAGRLIERQRRQMPAINLSYFISRLFVLLMLMTPWLFPRYPGEALALLVVLQAIPNGIANVAFTAAMADAIGLRQMGRVVSQRNALIWIAGTIGTLISVPILGGFPMPTNYQIVFGIGFLALLVSSYYISRLHLPDRPARQPGLARGARRPFLSWEAARGAWRGQPAYAWFVVAAFVYHAGLYAAVPLFPIYWVRVLHLSDTWVGVVTVIFGVASVVSCLLTPPLIRRWGNRRLLVGSAIALGLYPLTTALAWSGPTLIPVVILGGLAYGPLSISLFNRMIEVIPAGRRASYLGLYNAVINVAIFAAPLASTALAGTWGVGTLLLVGAGVRFFGGALFALSQGDAAEAPATSEAIP